MNKGYIYKITSPSGKIYIGQTININKRKAKYKSLKCSGQIKLFNSISKYTWENHTFEIIETINCCGSNNFLLDLFEIYWIEEYNSFRDGLNCTKGGSGNNGHKHTGLTKKIIGDKSRGKKLSNEAKNKIGDSSRGRKMKPFTEEHKKKIGSSRIYKVSDETRLKMSEGMKGKNSGKIRSQETKEKISKVTKGRNVSDETRLKISSSLKGKKYKILD